MTEQPPLMKSEISSNETNPAPLPAYKHIKAYTRNRELSWLNFNRRVLHEAMDDETPDYEALKFVAIFTSNLEEFFRVRVGSLTDLSYVNQGEADSKTGMTAQEQLDAIYAQSRIDIGEKDQVYENVMNKLNTSGIYDLKYVDLTKEEKKQVQAYYRSMIEPILAPQIIDSHHPFPFIPNNSLHIVLELSGEHGKTFGLVRIPEKVKSYFLLKREKVAYIRVENIVKHFAPELFNAQTVNNVSVINVIRNADIDTEDYLADHDFDYRAFMKEILKKRKHLQAVAIHANHTLGKKLRSFLCEQLSIKDEQIVITSAPLIMEYVYEIEDLLVERQLTNLLYKPYAPYRNVELQPQPSFLDQVLKKDFLYIYPYENVDEFIRLLDEASEDPRVVSIRITIYRLAKNSRVVRSLVRAAENGKEVTALMELQARFDEASNINYSETLQAAGCNVGYGLPGYKVHSKICLITLQDDNQLRHITQIGTGNYNEKTSKAYTDLSFITSREDIGEDGVNFFHNMAIGNIEGDYHKLIVSPISFKSTIIQLINQEIQKGPAGEIFFKFNSFTDKELIMKIAEASAAGVKIRLIIRGISCLRPGLANYTEKVEIRSIVGRYLEHPRIYKFGCGDNAIIYIGSADLMTRNTERRVEISVPIEDDRLKEKISYYLASQWKDNYKARRMQPDGNFALLPRHPEEAVYIHQYRMMEWARKLASETPLASASSPSLWEKLYAFLRRLFKLRED